MSVQPTIEPATAAEALVSVVYSSAAVQRFDEADLASLLITSRRNNAARGLSGMLLHRDGRFMQVLEGPERAVRAALAVIERDPRHDGMWTLTTERVARRRFGAWAMHYRAVTAADEAAGDAWFGSGEPWTGPSGLDGTRAGELLTRFAERC